MPNDENNGISIDDVQDHSDDVLGEIYSKRVSPSDIVVDNETGFKYVKNQILLSAHIGVDRLTIEKMVSELDARIVGYIELTNDYQLEFIENKTLEETTALIEWVCKSSYVSNCSLNYFIENENDSEMPWEDALYTDDIKAWNKGGKTAYGTGAQIRDEGSLLCKTGDNWGLKALNIPAAWQIANHDNSVRIGIYDHGFAIEHEDLSFEKQYNNDLEILDDRSHGTHVAGIIAAKHNKIGIAGVSTNAGLVTYTYDGKGFDTMKEKVAFATLIGNHVKVINYSQTTGYELAYAASNVNAKKHITAMRNVEALKSDMEEFFLKLYDMGYDFNIVTSAGNTNGKRFIEDDFRVYGYLEVKRDNSSGKKDVDVLAEYNSALNAITDPRLKQRIIVVGAVAHNAKENNTLAEFSIDSASNLGDRVDVVAPGFEILSTVPVSYPYTEIAGYALLSGTSMAAPYITGIIALMYQSNPELSAEDAKRIVCDRDNFAQVIEFKGANYYMPDAEKCVRAALDLKDVDEQEENKENGIVIGKIRLSDGKESGVVQVFLTENDLTAPMKNDTFEFSTTSDGTFVCSVPEGTYKMSIQKQGYLPYLAWNVEVISEETNNLGTIELARVPSMMRLKGKVYHAGKGIPEATVRVRQGFRNKEGDYLLDEDGAIIEVYSDEEGYFEMEILEGEYTFEFTKDGYAPEYNNIRMELDANGRQTIEREIEVVYKYEDSYRIVLEWNKNSVTDLDICASVIAYGRNVARVSAKSHDNWLVHPEMRVIKDAKTGAETETILIAESEYILHEDRIYLAISVSDEYCRYGTTSGLHYDLGATIYLYKGDKLLQVFKAPRSIDRRVWYAFNIKEGDRIEVVNINTDAEP